VESNSSMRTSPIVVSRDTVVIGLASMTNI
jgi:hypothetical protein